jgi:hypothetical protein
MEEIFEKVLNKIVVPMNDRLVGVKVRKTQNSYNDYIVTYFINDRIDYSDGTIIGKETRSLYKMMGMKEDSHVIIEYRSIED